MFKWVPPDGYHTDPNYKTFSPRLGLAFQLNSKTVIRTGAAIIECSQQWFECGRYRLRFRDIRLELSFPWPAGPDSIYSSVGGSWSNPFAAGFTYPEKGTTTFAGQNIRVDFPDHPLAYIANWNFRHSARDYSDDGRGGRLRGQ